MGLIVTSREGRVIMDTDMDTDMDTELSAAREGRLDIIEGLSGAVVQELGGHLLHVAAGNNQMSVLRHLLVRGVDVNIRDDRERTALHRVAHHSQLAALKLLVAQGADVNVQDGLGNTALHYQARRRFLPSVRYLLAQGADVDKVNHRGQTPIYNTFKTQVEIVACLVEGGASLSHRDSDGFTPLHWAARKNSLWAVTYLVKSGADVDAKTDDGWTAQEEAEQRLFMSIVGYLERVKEVGAQRAWI